MKRLYDFAFGIGGACCCTQALRNAGLQYASFPWDWVAGSDIRTRIDQIRDGFSDWLPKDSLEKIDAPEYRAGVVYRNRKTGVVFAHDFPPRGSFDADYPHVEARYLRREANLSRLVSASSRVLVVWVDVPACPKATDEDRAHVLDILSARWPGVGFDLLTFSNEEGRRIGSARDEEDGRVRKVSFDYRDYAEEAWVADNKALGRWLRAEYVVPDYRTAEERRTWRKIARQKEFGRYNAKTLREYVVTKLQYKIYVHFMKRLSRKGVI